MFFYSPSSSLIWTLMHNRNPVLLFAFSVYFVVFFSLSRLSSVRCVSLLCFVQFGLNWFWFGSVARDLLLSFSIGFRPACVSVHGDSVCLSLFTLCDQDTEMRETLSAHDWHDDADHAFRLPRMKHWQSQSGRHCVVILKCTDEKKMMESNRHNTETEHTNRVLLFVCLFSSLSLSLTLYYC